MHVNGAIDRLAQTDNDMCTDVLILGLTFVT